MSQPPPPDSGPSVASAALDKVEVSSRRPRCGSYPPISSIPCTSRERLAQAAEVSETVAETVLYLAYGSNMSAETFMGVRRIRPLSQVNVSVPALRLTFDLPGVPYREPCFANVGFRPVPEKPPADARQQGDGWDGRLMGIVYEVTLKDWRTIMRTEGAGSSYKEIIVPCIPMTPSPEAPRPILARTLYALHSDDDGQTCSWWRRLSAGRWRPEAGYAQPSARYLKLLRDGAREHGLPDDYQRYLASLHPYTMTHWRQRVGQVLFLGSWAPLLVFFLSMTGFLADETGKLPRWLAGGVTTMFNVMWTSYDAICKPVFGDGERTEARGGDGTEGDGTEATLMANGKGS